MDYTKENNFQNIYKPSDNKFYNNNSLPNNQPINNNKNNNQIYNFNYNNNDPEFNLNQNNNLNFNSNNIFGLNFHQDEENDDQIINSLHFSKFNMNSQNYINENNGEVENNNFKEKKNNFEQKIKNNRNMVYNNMNLNIKNYDIIEGEEPYQISISKYSESNFDNHSIFNNSKMNNNYLNNKNQIPTKKENVDNAILKNQKFNKKIPIKKESQNDNQKPHPNFIKHNLILNNNYYINNNSNITNNKNVPIIVHTKSFSSKRNPISNKKVNNKENYNTLNNYYKIPKTKHIKPKEKNNKNINSIKTK